MRYGTNVSGQDQNYGLFYPQYIWQYHQPHSQGPISSSRKYPGYGWSGVYACQPKPHRGWLLNLILSLLSREVNVLLVHRHYFEREASYLSEILPDQCFISTWTSVSVRCWLRGNFAYISLLFLNNRQQPAWDQFNQFFTPKDLNNREIIDGMLSSRSYFVDWELDLPLTVILKRKPLDFANVHQNFSLQENHMTVKLSIAWIQSNSKLKSLCQTLDISNSKQMHQCLRCDFANRKI